MESASLPNNGSQQADMPLEPSRAAEKLKLAVRQARIDDAERSRVVSELRGAEITRLEMLRDELQPVLAETPKEADLFDLALAPSEHPRLFIDMIAFVEIRHDRRSYRFLQDTRLGRVTIAESERIESITAAVTNYIARRLIEREKALAGDTTLERAKRRNIFVAVFGFLVEFFGAAVLAILVGIGGWTAWKYIAALLAQHHGAGH